MSDLYSYYARYLGDSSGFGHALKLLNDWNENMEHNNDHRYMPYNGHGTFARL
jgi:hypothetical protein